MQLSQLKRHKGFVMFVMLLFLQMLMPLSVGSLMMASKERKWLHLNEARRQAEMEMASQIRVIERSANRDCMLSKRSPQSLLNLGEKWWKQNACTITGAGVHIYYVVENLGVDPCALAAYQRLTFFALPIALKNARIMRQSVIAIPISESFRVDCHFGVRHIQYGRQHIREMLDQ